MQPENPAPPPSTPPPVVPPVPAAPEAAPSVPLQPLPPKLSKEDSDMLETGEHVVTIVQRHPIGIIAIYLEALVGLIAIAAIVLLISPGTLKNLSGQAYRLMVGISIVVIGLVVLILLIATYVYRQSRLIVTDKSLVMVIQKGLFIRKVSRLSMSNVEDVSAAHNGFLATIFSFGTLTVQTAGEEDNFIFKFCPTPDFYAQRILDARQAYARSIEENDGPRPT